MEARYRDLLQFKELAPEGHEAATARVALYQALGADAYSTEEGHVAVLWNPLVVPIRAFVTDPDGDKGKLYRACDRTGSCDAIGDHRRSSIRSTFLYEGDKWVNTGSFPSGGELCHRVVPLAAYTGPVPPHERNQGDMPPMYCIGYTGHIVEWHKQPHALAAERLVIYSYEPTPPKFLLPELKDDQAIPLAGTLVAAGRHLVLENKDAAAKVAQVIEAINEEQQRDTLRFNRCPLVFKADGRLWLLTGFPGGRGGSTGTWSARQLVELVRPEDLPPHIAPIRYPAGRGFGRDTGRIVTYLNQELAISDTSLYVGTFTPHNADERWVQAQRNLARQAPNTATPASTGRGAAPGKAKRQEPSDGPMEQLSFLP